MIFLYQNDYAGGRQKYLKHLLYLIGLAISLFILYAPVVHANGSYIEQPVVKINGYQWPNTSLRNGDTVESIRKDWIPMFKALSAGTVPGDKFTWSFENSPLYIDSQYESWAEQNFEYWAKWDLTVPKEIWPAAPEYLLWCVNESSVGMFDLYDFGYTTETREIEYANGSKAYRCALTSIYVKNWRTPYGPICSREEALSYYNECQNRIKTIVSKLIDIQSDGKPLTDEQKLKWIHDWLVVSVEYDQYGHTLNKEDSYATIKREYNQPWNEYGAIVDGRAVCQGYAYAFKTIVDELAQQTGIAVECEVAYNTTHAWNRVKLNGNWYHIDATRDDWGNDYLCTMPADIFLVSDSALVGPSYQREGGYRTPTSATEPATDHRYENQLWPRYKKDLSEFTVTLENPSGVYTCASNQKKFVPSVTVSYGKNVLPSNVYKVVRTDKLKSTGTASIKIVPAKDCYVLEGSVRGPDFKIIKAEINGTATSSKKVKLDKKTNSARPFDKTFKPFTSTYKYSSKSTSMKAKKSLTLKCGKDYTVEYQNNTKPGLATAIITLKGDYAGKITVNYQIDKIKISGSAKSTTKYKLGESKSIRPFDKEFKPFTTTYKYSSKSTTIKLSNSLVLKQGVDYTVKYKKNNKPGWARAIITLKGDYTGKVTVRYKITE